MSEAGSPLAPAGKRAEDGRAWVVVDAVAIAAAHGDLLVLVGKRQGRPATQELVLPGGGVRRDEDAEQATRRHLANVGLTGAIDCYLEQLHVYGSPYKDGSARVFCVAHLAFVPPSAVTPNRLDARVRWVRLDELQTIGAGVFASDHAQVLGDGLARMAELVERTTVARALLDEPFSIGDLRRVYEVIWGCTLPGANFRRKVRSIQGFVEPTGEFDDRGRGRAVPLYRRGLGVRINPAFLPPRGGGRFGPGAEEFFGSLS